MDIHRPPTNTEIRRLQDFLLSARCSEECMLVDEIDGLFAALICGPDVVMPSEWLPLVWGGEGPEFESDAEAEEILGIMMRMHNYVAKTVDAAAGYEPLLPTGTNELGDTEVDAEGWCRGFLEGVSLRSDLWYEREDPELKRLLLPVYALGLAGADPQIAPMLSEPGVRDRLIDMLPESVIELREYWRKREPDLPIRRSQPLAKTKLGRNDPCPCGSAKKYKNCCGAVEKPH